MIRAENLAVKAGGRWVLESLSFEVGAGQTVLVTGGNGSGKSLLAGAVAGLIPPAAGRVTLDGVDVRRAKARRRLGYLPQQCGLYDYLTVGENLRFFAAGAGVSWRRRGKVCADLLELVGLVSLEGAPASRLTPGQRQRLAVARTLVGDPPALVLDEPLSALDAEGRSELKQLLTELAAMGKAVLIVTGDPDGLAFDQLYEISQGLLAGKGVGA